jgi:putative hydrolase of the HAD superfamily
MRYSTLFFDLDGTVYASNSGLWEEIGRRMGLYMLERLGLPEDQVHVLRKRYFETYGTTLRGLQIHHHVDAEDYLAFVHDLPLKDYLQPAPELRAILLSLKQRCWIFTNADSDHARRVLSVLELEGCFEGIIDIRATQFLCKPEIGAYRRALILAGESDGRQCVLLDDSPVNLLGAHPLGFRTVLVGSNGQLDPRVDVTVSSLLSLPQAMPELWEVD